MTARNPANWLKHPLAEALLRFNLLPALFAHPARFAVDDQLQALPSLQRHRSAALLKQFGLDPSMGLQDPALPLAMLPEPQFKRMLTLLGAALNAPHIRRTISREDVALLKAQIGTEGIAVVRTPAADALAGLPIAPDWQPGRAGELCSCWGAAVLGQAFDAATEPVGARARLRLAPEADALRAPLSAAGLVPERALRIARDVLQSLEPAWLSSFGTSH